VARESRCTFFDVSAIDIDFDLRFPVFGAARMQFLARPDARTRPEFVFLTDSMPGQMADTMRELVQISEPLSIWFLVSHASVGFGTDCIGCQIADTMQELVSIDGIGSISTIPSPMVALDFGLTAWGSRPPFGVTFSSIWSRARAFVVPWTSRIRLGQSGTAGFLQNAHGSVQSCLLRQVIPG
jgi:hypothetical protein